MEEKGLFDDIVQENNEDTEDSYNKELFDDLLNNSKIDKIRSIFENIIIVEDEIKEGMRMHPMFSKKINDSFLLFCSSISNDILLRKHCKEIIERIVCNKSIKDILLGTKAEILYFIMNASEKAPLNYLGYGLYLTLFRDLFPEKELDFNINETHESWPGQFNEVINECQIKILKEREWIVKEKKDMFN